MLAATLLMLLHATPLDVSPSFLTENTHRRIRLIAEGGQPGAAAILVLGRGPDTGGTYRLLTRFAGPNVDKQELVRAPGTPWRRVRYLRVAVGASNGPQGWVAWSEIEVFPPGR